MLSCSTSITNDLTYENAKEIVSNKKIELSHIHVDTIVVNNPYSLSGDGFWKINGDSLYYFDRLLAVVDTYDKNGEFHSRRLGIGRGPGEVMEEIGTVCQVNEKWLLTEIYNIYQFSTYFSDKKMKFLFHFGEDIEERKQDLYANPDPREDIELYVPAYSMPQMNHLLDTRVLMKVSCEYPDFLEKEYYSSSALVAEYDFEEGSITKLMGKYPPCYQREKGAPAFANHYYSKYKNGKYLLSFALDKNIYICNNTFEPISAFGIKGDIQNEDYNLIDFQSGGVESYNFQEERDRKGFYTSLYYYAEEDLTFRVYKTGTKDEATLSHNPSRMQLYRGTELIGDVKVPDNFEIIAYQAPYFYADGLHEIGEDKDVIGIFKFKL